MIESWDMFIFWLVVGCRFLIPLAIPRYPLPGIVAALLLDAADQTIFQRFTSLNLDSYQGYDKALDVYYLVIAYISTLRNWTNLFAFRVSRFLIYYRLIGVALFELTQIRPLLMIFPNTFEYFFIFYETVRLRWDPKGMSNKVILWAVALIWIFIKLPQEYWLHIAQNDTTEFLNEYLFKMPIDTPMPESLAANPGITMMIVILIALAIFGVWWLLTKKLPKADWKLSFDADAHLDKYERKYLELQKNIGSGSVIDGALMEKIAMVSLVSIIFAQTLPGMKATNIQLVVGVGFVIVLNTILSHFLARKGKEWVSVVKEFVVMAGVNFGLVYVYAMLLPRYCGSVNLGNTMFFALLLTLLVTLFDRYRQVHVARFGGK